MTIRRVDPWSILKFAFVANLVLLGVYLLVGAVAWSFVRRLELVETVCRLASQVGYTECSVDGQALFDTLLVLGLLGVVIQTGVFVFLAFLANLIFDLVGGIAVTLEDDRPTTAVAGVRRGIGSTVGDARSSTASPASANRTGRLAPTASGPGAPVGAPGRPPPAPSSPGGTGTTTGTTSGAQSGTPRGQERDDDSLFGGR